MASGIASSPLRTGTCAKACAPAVSTLPRTCATQPCSDAREHTRRNQTVAKRLQESRVPLAGSKRRQALQTSATASWLGVSSSGRSDKTTSPAAMSRAARRARPLPRESHTLTACDIRGLHSLTRHALPACCLERTEAVEDWKCVLNGKMLYFCSQAKCTCGCAFLVMLVRSSFE